MQPPTRDHHADQRWRGAQDGRAHGAGNVVAAFTRMGQRAMGLDVGDGVAGQAGQRQCGADLVGHRMLDRRRGGVQIAPAEAPQVGVARVGADIHPLAVIIAKTNYILALGDLLKKRKSTITIPVYLADTLKLPERWAKTAMAEKRPIIPRTTSSSIIVKPENFFIESLLKNQKLLAIFCRCRGRPGAVRQVFLQ